jgi:hypothetical protein
MVTKLTQRVLLERLKYLIDRASAKGAGASRDQAKLELRETLRTSDWNTTFILYNLSVSRCRYLRSLGYPIPNNRLFTSQEDIDRINAYHERER